MADEKKIITEVGEAVVSLTGIFKALQEVINTNLQQQGQLITYMSELKKAIGSSKELKDFVKVSADLQKTQTTLTKTQQAGLKVQSEQEKLRQQELKTQQATANALKAEEAKKQALIRTEEASARQKARLLSEANKLKKASEQATSAYQRESARLLQLTKSAKDAAIQYGVNSKQAKALRMEQQKLDKQIKSVDASLGIHNRNVGNYGSAFGKVKNILGQFGLALGGARLAMAAFDGIIKNSQTSGDAWAVTVGGMKGAMEGLFQALGTGERNFKNLRRAMNEAAQAGRDYARAMDDLFEGGQGATIQTAELNKELANLEKQRDVAYAARDLEKTLEVVDQINDKELEILRVRQVENNRLYEAESKFIEERTGLRDADFISFLKNYRNEEELRVRMQGFLEEENRLQEEISQGRTIRYGHEGQTTVFMSESAKQAKEDLDLLRQGLTDYERIYARTLERYQGTTDEMVKRTVDAYAAIINAQGEFERATRRNEVRRANVIRELTAQTGDDEKTKIEKVKNYEAEILQGRLDLREEWAAKTKDIIDGVTQKELDDLDKVKAANDEKIKAIEKANEKTKEYEKEMYSEIKEAGIEAANLPFEMKMEQYQKDLEANAAYYDELLSNTELDTEQRDLLEAERLEKENEINQKRRETEKRQFLFNQGIKAADVLMDASKGIASATAQAPATFGASLAWIPLIKITAAAQLATILAQSIPQFYKGTENSPEGLAWVGEKGTELKIAPDGKASLTPGKPTLDYLEKGTKIIPHNELIEAVTNYSTASIINEGGPISNNDAMIAAALARLEKSNNLNNEKILKALSNNPQHVDKSIDRMRKTALQSKIQGKKLYS